ncbi:relaxin receptor 1 isoform X2 [Phymastichus coffea]|uniref:relaxin receptor 1 isoform X2 n=1 Tax=Phymastichus coffea TaxID=108790 RepID=UPI00273AACD7|nr:relaxin receptor 1 isoform X2 [Phymastichus coffea]
MRYKHIVTIGTVLITIFVLLAALMYYFNQDSCSKGTFPCANSTMCLPQQKWCNGEIDCPEKDDESITCIDLFGNWKWYEDIFLNNETRPKPRCPNVTDDSPGYFTSCIYDNCVIECQEYAEHEFPPTFLEGVALIRFENSSIPVLKYNSFERYSHLMELHLDNNTIRFLEPNVFANQKALTLLKLSHNNIREIRQGNLNGLISLNTLILDFNEIHSLDLSDLENSENLTLLDLTRNLLTSSNFYLPYLPALNELNLDENRLECITSDMFSRLPMLSSFLFMSTRNLSKLQIGHNEDLLPENLLPSLLPLKNSINSLNVEEIIMDDVEKDFFNVFTGLEFLYFKRFHYCTAYAPNVQKCKPPSDGVSSLSHLLRKRLLRIAVWGISCVTCLGNALVLWGRFTAKDENRVLSIVIRNLAVSDMLMGLYLFIIGIEDIRFRDNYKQEASAWISSWSCTIIGMIAMVSSEVSVLILSFMSVERFMLIVAPLRGHRAMTPQTAASSMIAVWAVGITLALIPAIHWRSSTRFYGLNGMCFPLHIDNPFLVGWEYSAFIFLGLNLLGLVIIGYVYAGMFISIWRTRHATPLSVGDSEFILRFFLIVLTDAVCWAPIIILKILALTEYPINPDLNSWVVIFILPVNSAVNPLLYTFTTPKFRERLAKGLFGRVCDIVSRKQSRSESQVSNVYNSKNTTSGTGIPRDSSIEEKQVSSNNMRNMILCMPSPKKSSIEKEKEDTSSNEMKNKNIMLCMSSPRKSLEKESKKNKSTDELYLVD